MDVQDERISELTAELNVARAKIKELNIEVGLRIRLHDEARAYLRKLEGELNALRLQTRNASEPGATQWGGDIPETQPLVGRL